MCRSIKKLRRVGDVPTEEELHGAALQFVRKISGYNAPSRMNQKAFQKAVRDVADSARNLFTALESRAVRNLGEREAAK